MNIKSTEFDQGAKKVLGNDQCGTDRLQEQHLRLQGSELRFITTTLGQATDHLPPLWDKVQNPLLWAWNMGVCSQTHHQGKFSSVWATRWKRIRVVLVPPLRRGDGSDRLACHYPGADQTLAQTNTFGGPSDHDLNSRPEQNGPIRKISSCYCGYFLTNSPISLTILTLLVHNISRISGYDERTSTMRLDECDTHW